jgi:hypothetical protein
MRIEITCFVLVHLQKLYGPMGFYSSVVEEFRSLGDWADEFKYAMKSLQKKVLSFHYFETSLAWSCLFCWERKECQNLQ